jgi:hypothetical protein
MTVRRQSPIFPSDIRQIAQALGGEVSAGQICAPAPGHSPADRGMSVRVDAAAPGGFVVNLFNGGDPIAARDYVRGRLGLPACNGAGNGTVSVRDAAPIASYPYRNADGVVVYEVLRYKPKSFAQRVPNGTGGFIYKLDGVPRVLYRLPELMQFPSATVFICEGEKDADAVAALGLCATTISGGTKMDA